MTSPSEESAADGTRYDDLTDLRFSRPAAITDALTARPAFTGIPAGAKLLIIAADHPARGALAIGGRPVAMGDRRDLLDRTQDALARPGVHGFLGTADMIEDLTLRGALDGKVVFGSMNRGGLAGSTFEIDDRFTGYDPAGIASAGLDGGKMLLRICLDDPASALTLEACARAVGDLASHHLIAMVEPFLARRVDGALVNQLTTDAVIRSVAIASGLASTSAYTWLKLPVVAQMERVMAASTLPALILGGEVSEDQDAALSGWESALRLPGVKGLVIGRSLLYPPDDDVTAAVDAAVSLL
ncbi:hypothetical protein SAMN05216410_1166 [Sanguibacter gelidistatuariae]|uniref:Cgl0159-like domain-containing protein n=1 Tax=Sanguibacter gelidistatuariae TaxID=1814289 RepID=A0A1G6HPV6_9MICO|nr:deoxyribose-phosphate aldolase [Sanguibacter gelidistatuariae]SDB96231.1 hypothetical protein SAMN05216410_1166 [Sanguibacter gelidistatuariae]